jgi:nucleotide-binding universal stress UspA family protein
MNGFEIGTDGPQVIVVGIDGSDTSLRATAYAWGLARRQGSRLIFVFAASSNTITAFLPDATASASGCPRPRRPSTPRFRTPSASSRVTPRAC